MFNVESAMGCKVNAQTEESDYVKAVHRFVFTEPTITLYFIFLYNFSMSMILLVRGMTPWYNFDFLYNHTPLGKDYRQGLSILRHFTDQV